MSYYSEIVERVRDDRFYVGFELDMEHVVRIEALCDAVELLARELDAAKEDKMRANREADRADDTATHWKRQYDALTVEVERLRGDAERLDWLQSEEDSVGRVMSLVVKVNHDRSSSGWANISGDVRVAIDAARRALGGDQ